MSAHDSTQLEDELRLAQTVIESDVEMAQRNGLIAHASEGLVWMMEFDAVNTSGDFEDIAITASNRWRRTTEEVQQEIDHQLD